MAELPHSRPITPPRLLYKYRSLAGKAAEFVKSIFDSNEFYFAEPAELNDPAEARFQVSLDADPKDLFAHFVDFFQHHKGNRREDAEILAAKTIELGQPSPDILEDIKKVAVESVRARAYILSLSSRGDDRMMWEAYADLHRGVCLEFDSTIGHPSILSLALPVVYQADLPTFYPYRAWARMQLQNRMESYEAVKPMAFTKDEEWSHEQEWRVVMFEPSKLRSFPPASLVGVILGARIAPEDEQLVREWIVDRVTPLRIYRAEFCPDPSRVEVRPE